jgi:hypothetical protein
MDGGVAKAAIGMVETVGGLLQLALWLAQPLPMRITDPLLFTMYRSITTHLNPKQRHIVQKMVCTILKHKPAPVAGKE